MTPDEITTMRAAIDRYVADCSILANDTQQELQRARELRDRFAAATQDDPHIRDEDLVPEVIRPGDLLRVSTAMLVEWRDLAGFPTVPVMVKHITRDPDGTKTVVVSSV